ncbi:TOBE domain-containing protein [Paenibacillus sp. P22]|uniref:TOBE domain-containing protein n=1 Tax=Paenibacillus sp. P22 TaxID=483908 RepID=UPI000434F2D0|nr:TOBE domain-containing protein [Paenibacillus sp. P22]CDN42962.1 hypothetical protein BN871_CG_00010 [Paenibacillus sp. P22]
MRSVSVQLGVRPEHVRLSAALPEGEDSGYTAAVVQMKEETGADSYVYLLAGDTRVIARTDPESAYQPEEQAAFGFQMDKIHLFDESSGVSLRREQA